MHITDDAQEKRFRARATDPRKQWKLSPMDVASWNKRGDYSKARDAMLAATNTEFAPRSIVDANIKRNARLNVIRHVLSRIDYEGIEHDVIDFPDRPDQGDHLPPAPDESDIIPDHSG